MKNRLKSNVCQKNQKTSTVKSAVEIGRLLREPAKGREDAQLIHPGTEETEKAEG